MNPVKRLLSFRRRTLSVGDRSMQKTLEDSKSWNIYRSIKELPLERFIRMSTDPDMNLSYLDKDYNEKDDRSNIPSEVFIGIWAEITMEFTEGFDLGSLKESLSLKVTIDHLHTKFSTIISIIGVLNQSYEQELVDILKEYGYNFSFDHTNEDKYRKDLKRVTSLAKNILVDIRRKEAELMVTVPQEEGKTKTLDDWEEDIIILNDEAGFRIDWSVETVSTYIKRYKRLLKKLQAQQKKPKLPNV